MAIDTAAKRASVLGFAFAPLLLVVPDGSIDQGDRQTIAHLYSGVLAIPFTPSAATFVASTVIVYPAVQGSVKINGGDR